jgi:hypothetical protein
MPTVSRLLALSKKIDTVGHRIIYSKIDESVVRPIREIYYSLIDAVNDKDAAVVAAVNDAVDALLLELDTNP